MDIIALLIAVAVCELAGGVGAIFTRSSVSTWYRRLKKPGFNPPDRVFAPVWTLLYLLMGIALSLVWEEGAFLALAVFALQLVLNVLWSFVFFGLRKTLAGFVVILLLWASIVWTMLLFYPVSIAAFFLLLPYFLWVGFAAVLNYHLWRLNR